MKSILFLMPALLGGGAEKVLVDIFRNFDYTNYEVTLFLEYEEGVYLQDVPKEVKLLHLHHKNNIWFQRIHRRLVDRGWYPWFHEAIYRRMFLRVLRNKRYNTIISFLEGSSVKFHSYIVDRADQNLSWVHIDLLQKHWTSSFFRNTAEERTCYEKMDKVVFVSNDAKSAFCKLFIFPEDKCVVQYNIIDVNNIRSLSMSGRPNKEKFTICMIGRLNRQKRYDRALEVANKLKNHGYEFEIWILGEGELLNEIKSRIEFDGLSDVVKLKGFVRPPYGYLAQSDLLLCTSESEGFSLVVAEAFSLGIPVVSTNVSGPRELIGDSEYGILTEQSPDEIFNAVAALMDDAELRHHYSQQGIERSAMFGVEESMRNLYALI